MQKQVISLLEAKAKELNLPYYIVEEVFMSQFKFVRERIKEANINEEFPTILLNNFGKFSLSKRKLIIIKDRVRFKQERENGEQ